MHLKSNIFKYQAILTEPARRLMINYLYIVFEQKGKDAFFFINKIHQSNNTASQRREQRHI